MLDTLSELICPDNRFVREWRTRHKPVVGYACSYTPEELIYAGGILPVRVLGDLKPSKSADVHLPINVCSFAKSCLNLSLEQECLFDGYIASNSCDNQRKIYDLWRHLTTIERTHFINTPHSTTEGSLRFFLDELQRLRDWLIGCFDVKISRESLEEAIDIFNENRQLLRKISELRKSDPPLISGSEVLDVVLSSMLIPKDKHNELAKQVLDEVKAREAKIDGGVRLMVSGSVMGSSDVLRLMESVGGQVVADDLCTGSRYFSDLVEKDVDPLKAIAKRYLLKTPCPFMHSSFERFAHVKDLVKSYGVEGVIIFSLKCCDIHAFDSPMLVEELEEDEGVPVLLLDWEYSLSGIAQIRTRIEAFVEMLEGIE